MGPLSWLCPGGAIIAVTGMESGQFHRRSPHPNTA
jgi:hypothetical protein